MNNTRRRFISQLTLLTGTAALSKPLTSAAAVSKCADTLFPTEKNVAIYHTNDLHGNINTVYKSMGGLGLVKAAFENEKQGGILFDAGGFINNAKGLPEQKRMVYMMNAMGYKAAGLSNHELAIGRDNLATLISRMQFTLVNCNHDFDNDLNLLIRPYIIINYNNIKIGVTGVSSPLKGIKYNDAIQSANKMAAILRNDKKCDLVICLSHLGSRQEGDRADNQKLAQQSENIDMIIGGDNSKMLPNTQVLKNKLDNEVILAQTAWKGLMAGRTIIDFNKSKQRVGIRAKHFIPGTDNHAFETMFADLTTNRNIALTV